MRASNIVKLALVLLCFVQSSPASLQKQSDLTHQISNLNSDDMQTRMTAYMKIKGDPEALKRPNVRVALVDLLDRENQLIARTNSVVGPSVDEKYGEGYAVYVLDLLDTVVNIADWHNVDQLCVIARGPYDSRSSLTTRLATEGGAALIPCLLRMTGGDKDDRASSFSILLQITTVTEDLSPALREQINRSITAILHDSDPDVRLLAVSAAGKFGTAQIIPLLDEIARTDPASRIVNGTRRFDVREYALKAIRSIHERAKTQ
jgi:hypothetical protein